MNINYVFILSSLYNIYLLLLVITNYVVNLWKKLATLLKMIVPKPETRERGVKKDI